MIRRLYIDNVRCLVNFEYRPQAFQLLYGLNGTGKSTVFETLAALRNIVTLGETVGSQFPTSVLTAWQTRADQRVELEIEGNDGVYEYKLLLEHIRAVKLCRIASEELLYSGHRLYYFDGQNAHLFGDDYSAGPVFPQESNRSALASIPARADNRKLVWFRERMGTIYMLAIDPLRMDMASFAEVSAPDARLTNFASWYRHLTQDSPERMGPLFESLREVIEGFAALRVSALGEAVRVLEAVFEHESGQQPSTFKLPIRDLSTGQRCLIALFTILHCAVRRDTTFCIDEPDNFIATREMQPWINEMRNRVEQEGGQCLMISHHPEFINLLAVRNGAHFTREGQGPVRIQDVDWSATDALTPAEILARGWET